MYIDLDEMNDYEFERRYAGEHGRGFNKTLDIFVKGGNVRYEVKYHGALVISTDDSKKAVDAYNLSFGWL